MKIKSSLIIVLFISLLCRFHVIAQTDSLLKSTQIEINTNLFGLSIGYEGRIADKITLIPELKLMTDGGLNVSRYNFSQSMQVIRPVIGLESRYYYNQSARTQKGKRTGNNSANFWGLSVIYAFESIKEPTFKYGENITIDGTSYFVEYPIEEYSLFAIAPTWGIQRMMGNKFSFDLNLGASVNYFSNYKEWMVGPHVGVRLGYVMR